MAQKQNAPTDSTPPTLPPSMVPGEVGPTTTTTTPTGTTSPQTNPVASAAAWVQRMDQVRNAPTGPAPTGGVLPSSVFAPSNTRNVLGIGGYITLDPKTGNPINYTPSSGGYPLSGSMAQGVGLYYEGAAQDVLKSFSPEALVSTQANLYRAGYLSSYTPGRITAKVVSAVERVMGDANTTNSVSGTGLTWEQMLAAVAANGGRTSSGKATVRVSNPLDIEAAVNQVAQQLIGRTLDDATMQRFVQAYQAAERGAAYGTTQAPNVQTFTLDKLTQMFPTETYGHQFGSYMEALQKRYGA